MILSPDNTGRKRQKREDTDRMTNRYFAKFTGLATSSKLHIFKDEIPGSRARARDAIKHNPIST